MTDCALRSFCNWVFVLKFRSTPGSLLTHVGNHRNNRRIVSYTDCSRKHLDAKLDSFILTLTHASSYVQLVATLCCSLMQGPHSANTAAMHCEQLRCEASPLPVNKVKQDIFISEKNRHLFQVLFYRRDCTTFTHVNVSEITQQSQ